MRILSLCLIPSILMFGCSTHQPTTSKQLDAAWSGDVNAGILLENYDTSVKPGDDFYRYTNGNWLKKTTIPADKSNYGMFSVLNDKAESDLKAILKAEVEQRPDSMVSTAYTTFLDTENLQDATILKPIFDQIDAIQKHEELPLIFGELSKLGVTHPYGFWIDQDKEDPNQYAIYLTQAGLGMPEKSYYLDDTFKDVRTKYQLFINQIASKLNVTISGQKPSASHLIYETEKKLAEISWDRAKRREADKVYNPVIAQNLTTVGDGTWAVYLKASGFEGNPGVVFREKSYFEQVGPIIKDTSIDVWKAYLKIHTAIRFAPYMNQEWVDLNFGFFGTTLSGTTENRARWKRAISFVESTVGDELGKAYVEKHFPAVAKEKMLVLIENLRAAFKKRIEGLTWMSDATKAKAQEKLAMFVPKVGYPDEWKSYEGLELKTKDLVGNAMRSAVYEHMREVTKIGTPVNRKEWFMPPQMVNAYYNPGMNEIVFPAAILQPPFFDWTADDAVNYGAIGGVIGHELSHGFDDQGRKTNGLGQLKDWWTEEDAEQFKAAASRLVEQFNGYSPLKDQHVNGQLTLGENIADLGGITVAHLAYKMSLKDRPAPVLYGLTGEQRFFLGWSQVWARKYREPELLKRLKTDPHSPSEYRVNGVVFNVDAFYDAFNIAESDPLYVQPENRVRIW